MIFAFMAVAALLLALAMALCALDPLMVWCAARKACDPAPRGYLGMWSGPIAAAVAMGLLGTAFTVLPEAFSYLLSHWQGARLAAMSEAAGVGIIGGADGPTTIYVAGNMGGLLSWAVICAQALCAMVTLWVYGKRRSPIGIVSGGDDGQVFYPRPPRGAWRQPWVLRRLLFLALIDLFICVPVCMLPALFLRYTWLLPLLQIPLIKLIINFDAKRRLAEGE